MSAMSSVAFMIFLIVCLLLYGGIIVAQIFLSRRQNRFLGLILPIVHFLLALIVSCTVVVPGQPTAYVSPLFVLLLCNIPTVVLLILYFACRPKKKGNPQIQKMNIQDL